METYRSIQDRTRRQKSLITSAELRGLGLNPKSKEYLLASGRLERLHGRVFRLSGSEETEHQRALAAVLGVPGVAAVSYGSAAALWKLPGYQLKPFHVTTLASGLRQPKYSAVLHQPRLLLANHIVTVDGVPVTTPVRTAFDLAASVHPKRLERIIDNLWARRLLNHYVLANAVAELAKRGRSGTTNMRAILANRGPEYTPAASGLELRFADLCKQAGLPAMKRQVDLGDSTMWIGRVDFFDEELRLVVEIDSGRFHEALVDAEADAIRQQALEAAGFWVVRFTEYQIWHRRDEVIRTLKAVRATLNPRTA